MIADQLIDLVTDHPNLAPVAAGLMADVLAVRELSDEECRMVEVARDAAVAAIQKEIDDLRTELSFLELELGGPHE